jgi:MFS transporter, ACS family, hexuronate transporter
MTMLRRLYALRWWMISLITIGTVFNYLTRAILGVVVTQPGFVADTGVTEQEYSWVTAFFQGGLLLQPVAGYVMDVIGLKMGFGIFAAAWAVLTGLHGAAMNWQMLAAFADSWASPRAPRSPAA